MLGFDAIGRLALGQSRTLTTVIYQLIAVPGSFAVTGVAAFAKIVQISNSAAFAYTGNNAVLTNIIAANSAAFGISANPAVFRLMYAASPQTTYIVTGNTATLGAGGLPAATGMYAVTGVPAAFILKFAGSVGQYTFTGNASNYKLNREDWLPTVGMSESWTPSIQQSEAWTPSNVDNEVWSKVA